MPIYGWSSNTAYVDNLIRDYLLKRAFSTTLKAFDADVKNDKDKGFRPDKVVQHMLGMINTYDIDSLRSYWKYLDSRIFSVLDHDLQPTVKKLETSLYRLYAINCVQNGKKRECLDFFDKLCQDLHGLPEWKEWFGLPFIPHADQHKNFAIYFSKGWLDSVQVSLQNFIAVTFAGFHDSMQPPDLLKALDKSDRRIDKLEAENYRLKQRLKDHDIPIHPPFKDHLHRNPPNYVKSLGVPAGLREEEPAVAQPQRKKIGLIGFSKKSSSNSFKQKAAPQVAKSAPPPTAAAPDGQPPPKPSLPGPPEVMTSSAPVVTSSSVDPVTTAASKMKKVSGYQQQRRELFGARVSKTATDSTTSAKTATDGGKPTVQFPSGVPSLSDALAYSPSVTRKSEATTESNGFDSRAPDVANGEKTLDFLLNTTQKLIEQQRVDAASPAPVRSTPAPVRSTPAPVRSTPPQSVLPAAEQNTFLLLSSDEYKEHSGAIVQCSFSSSGDKVASCDADGVVKVWSYEPQPSTLATVMSQYHFMSVGWCQHADDLLFMGSVNGVLRLYDVSTKLAMHDDMVPGSRDGGVAHITCHPHGRSVALVCVHGARAPSGGGKLMVWSMSGNTLQRCQCLHESRDSVIRCVTFDASGKHLACGDSKGTLRLFDAEACQLLNIMVGSSNLAIDGLQVSCDDTRVFTLQSSHQLSTLTSWNLHKLNDAVEYSLPKLQDGGGGEHSVALWCGRKLAMPPSGKHAVIATGNRGVVYTVDDVTSSLRHELTLGGNPSASGVMCVDWASARNCTRCLTGCGDGSAHVSTLLIQ